MEVACGQYGDVVSGLVVAAKTHAYAEYQKVAPAAGTAAVNEKPINNSLKVSCGYIMNIQKYQYIRGCIFNYSYMYFQHSNGTDTAFTEGISHCDFNKNNQA